MKERRKVWYAPDKAHAVTLCEPDRDDSIPYTCEHVATVHRRYGGRYKMSSSGLSCQGHIEDPVPLIVSSIHRRERVDMTQYIPIGTTDEGHGMYIFEVMGDSGYRQCWMAVILCASDARSITLVFSDMSYVSELLVESRQVKFADLETCDKYYRFGLIPTHGYELPGIFTGDHQITVYVHGHHRTGGMRYDIPGPDYARVSGAAQRLREEWAGYGRRIASLHPPYPDGYMAGRYTLARFATTAWRRWYLMSPDDYPVGCIAEYLGCDDYGHPRYRLAIGVELTLYHIRSDKNILSPVPPCVTDKEVTQ